MKKQLDKISWKACFIMLVVLLLVKFLLKYT
jgi:hypothetical protein